MNGPLLLPSTTSHHFARDHFDFFAALAFGVLEPGSTLSHDWYLRAMAAALMDVESGACRRLLIMVPPRSLKSLMASVMFPAWVMGRDPSQKFICVSYSQELASTFSRKFRRLIQSDFYASVFPKTAASVIRAQENDVQTHQGGYRFSTSLGGTVTGIGADYILIDDLMKPLDANFPEARQRAQQFVAETLLSRLNNKRTGRIVSIQQRLHEDDIVAYFKEKGGYRELELPAIAVRDEIIPLTHGQTHSRKIGDLLSPEREPYEVLEQLRREIGNRGFQAQWQQDPTPSDSAHVFIERIQRFGLLPPRHRLQKVVQSWDPASSTEPHADYSVGTTWGHDGEAWHMVDLVRVRLTYSDLLACVRLERNRWQTDLVLVENASVGLGLIKDLQRDHRCEGMPQHRAPFCSVVKIKPREGKQERMMSQVERLYEGFAKLPREAPWLDTLHKELLAFPQGRHDDQVDSISQFLCYARNRLGPRFFDNNYRPDPKRRP